MIVFKIPIKILTGKYLARNLNEKLKNSFQNNPKFHNELRNNCASTLTATNVRYVKKYASCEKFRLSEVTKKYKSNS